MVGPSTAPAAWGQPSSTHRPSILNPYGGAGGSTDNIRPCAVRSGATGRALAFTQSRPTSGARRSGAWLHARYPCRPRTRAHQMDHCGDWSQASVFRTLSKATGLDRLVGIALIASAGEGPHSNIPARGTSKRRRAGGGMRQRSRMAAGGSVLYRRRPVAARQGNLGQFLFDHLARSPLTRTGRDFVEERIGAPVDRL